MDISPSDLDVDPGWSQTRWVEILDRVEHRQPDVGLRFWAPPLWLEVTMTGPDSDLWPAISDQVTSWDWQSNAPCVEVAALAAVGADDDRLLAAVARYTIENLVLNAAHEIGEWFRFDGRRLFPAHRSGTAGCSDFDNQGNGAVTLRLEYGKDADGLGTDARLSTHDERRRQSLVSRLGAAVAPSRFTYLPRTTISYEAAGPVIRRWSSSEPSSAWASTWSTSTLDAAAADGPLVALIARDVHTALVLHEADRICRAFHLDGTRPWSLRALESTHRADPPDTDAPDLESLSISIAYADTCDTIAGLAMLPVA